MDMQTLTEKLVARKDGAIGWIVFNNPQKHNAVSLEMWQALPVMGFCFVITAGLMGLLIA